MTAKKDLGTLSFFCDESCYKINDGYSHMAIATVWCRKDRKKDITRIIRKIKEKYINKNTELKWVKVSNATLNMYKEIFDAIKQFEKLRIRIEVANKNSIKKEAKERWYDTMYYKLIEFPLNQTIKLYKVSTAEIYSDVMDTHSVEHMEKVSRFLKKHFNNKVAIKSKVCESKDVTLIQIADLLAGAATYSNRKIKTSSAKLELIEHIEKIFNIKFTKTTKVNQTEISCANVFLYEKEANRNDF